MWLVCNFSGLLLVQVQLTDFENSAYVVFVVLLTRVILSYKLDFLIPLSKVRMCFSIAMGLGICRLSVAYLCVIFILDLT